MSELPLRAPCANGSVRASIRRCQRIVHQRPGCQPPPGQRKDHPLRLNRLMLDAVGAHAPDSGQSPHVGRPSPDDRPPDR